jgi:acyl-CoA thioester hydrolase
LSNGESGYKTSNGKNNGKNGNGKSSGHNCVTETTLRVRYAETDKMGVVYHSNYIIWFEVGRVEMLRSFGFTYKEMESVDDTHLPVVEVRCRYKAPALYDDEIVVRTHLRNVRESLIHFGYECFRKSDNALLAEGETVHLVLDGTGNRRSFPEKYRAPFKTALQGES